MKARRGSLLPKLYGAGVVLVIGSAIVAYAISTAYDTLVPREHGRWAHVIATGIASSPDPQAALDRAHDDIHLSATIYDAEGDVTAHAGVPQEAPQALAEGEVRRTRRFHFQVGVSNGRVVVLEFAPPPPPRSVAWVLLGVLVLIGIAAAFARRWLGKPLLRLGETARAIADGNLSARTELRSNDEIGETGRAFDAMAERVESLLRSHRELLAGVSHELKTPIARIRVALELAQEANATPDVGSELTGIGEDLAELESLVEDVLAGARIELANGRSAALPIHPQPMLVSELLQRAKARFTERHPARVVTLAIDDDVERELDPVLVRRAIENVLDNAHKYSPAEAPIRMRVTVIDGHAEITVEDHGLGISAADRARVFTPFFRVDSPEVRASSGLGLGLALARRVVEAHDGSIDLDSTPGEGTTVRIRL